MSFSRRVVSVSAVASVILAFGLTATAQETAASSDGPVVKMDWNDRVLSQGASSTPGVQPAHAWSAKRAQRASQIRNVGVTLSADYSAHGQRPLVHEMALDPESESFMVMSEDDGYLTAAPASSCDCGGGCDGGDCGGGTCSPGKPCHNGCGACLALAKCLIHETLRSVDIFAGVQGFKGPVDLGANGNFGFHEGFNYAAPLGGPYGLGYQLGAQAVQSNLDGNLVLGQDTSSRDQVFFTGGIFRRSPCGGFQWGAAFDYLHDSYFDETDITQLRTELSCVRANHREIGFMGTFGGKDDRLLYTLGGPVEDELEALGTYALFYRRHFTGGGQGRFWAGATTDGDAIFGADCTVPLGTCWAVENSFTYMMPKEGGVNAQDEETWAMAMHLVWYPGRQASCLRENPYRPFFGVADNGTMITQRNP